MLIDWRNFYDQLINDPVKQYDEVRKVAIGQDDDYTTGCLLDYAYFKDSYKLIAVDLSKQKLVDADLRVIQQIVLKGVAKVKESVELATAAGEKLRLYTVLERLKETVLEFYKGTAKDELPYELLLTTRQKTKLGNAFNNIMPADIKLSKTQISKINQSGGFLGALLSKIVGPLVKNNNILSKNVLALLEVMYQRMY